MAQQTAVEWFIEQIKDYDFSDIKDTENYIIKIPAWVLTEKEKQAKQMEKEQIIHAWREGDNDSMYSPKELDKQAEQYYNETYKKQ